jgi:tripartite-type tricarboxylate transporter receptor subunit TctC
MDYHSFRWGAALIVGMLVSLVAKIALGEMPSTIKIVVPFSAGGGADIAARHVADQIGHTQGITAFVENRPGAASVIATEAVAHAEPDGSTVLVAANSFIIHPHLKKLSYDPLTSFEPICYLVRSPQVLAVNSASPYRTLPDLFEDARNKPGELTLASVGPATAQQIAFEMLKRLAQVDIRHVPYPGNAPAVNALLGGHVTSVLANYPEIAEQAASGRLRALATGSRVRIDQLPDIPTIAELGYRHFEAETWLGVVAPAKTSKETLSRLADWFSAAIEVPVVKSKLVNLGLYPVGLCGNDFALYLRKQYEDYGRIIRETLLQAN